LSGLLIILVILETTDRWLDKIRQAMQKFQPGETIIKRSWEQYLHFRQSTLITDQKQVTLSIKNNFLLEPAT